MREWANAHVAIIDRFHKVVSGGCNCNRDSLKALQSIPGWTVSHVDFMASNPFFIAPFIAGVAVKTGSLVGGKL